MDGLILLKRAGGHIGFQLAYMARPVKHLAAEICLVHRIEVADGKSGRRRSTRGKRPPGSRCRPRRSTGRCRRDSSLARPHPPAVEQGGVRRDQRTAVIRRIVTSVTSTGSTGTSWWPPLIAGGDGGNRVDDVHAVGYPAEYGVAEIARAVIQEVVVAQVDKELRRRAVDDAGARHCERAADIRLAVIRFVLDGVARRFLDMSSSMPPPWIMKFGMTRWKIVPSKMPSVTYWRKFSQVIGAFSSNSSTLMSPWLVLIVIMMSR